MSPDLSSDSSTHVLLHPTCFQPKSTVSKKSGDWCLLIFISPSQPKTHPKAWRWKQVQFLSSFKSVEVKSYLFIAKRSSRPQSPKCPDINLDWYTVAWQRATFVILALFRFICFCYLCYISDSPFLKLWPSMWSTFSYSWCHKSCPSHTSGW